MLSLRNPLVTLAYKHSIGFVIVFFTKVIAIEITRTLNTLNTDEDSKES